MSTKELIERYNEAKAERSKYESTLSEIGKYVWPKFQDMVVTKEGSEGQVRTVDIYDSTAIEASKKMTAGIFSYLMPVGSKWHEFVVRGVSATAIKNEDISNWLSYASVSTHKEIWRSNFQREMFKAIRSLVVFGTTCISVEYIKDGITFKTYHLGNIFFEEDYNGYVDVVYRRIFYTARQAYQKFADKVGKKILEAVKKNKLNQKFEFVHCIIPNKKYEKGSIANSKKKFSSIFINIEDEVEVQKDGKNENPYLVARYDTAPEELLGYSPNSELLPEIKMLNRMKYTYILGAESAADPAMMMEDDGVIGQPDTSPGSTLYVRAGSQYPQPWKTGFNPALNDVFIGAQQQIIKDGNFEYLFQALANHKNMTLGEARMRIEEGMVLLAPIISALLKELQDPLVTRVLNLMIENNLMAPKPADFDVDIEYQGRLALAMTNMQLSAIESVIAKWAPLTELYPVMDNLLLDEAFRRSARGEGVESDLLRTTEIEEEPTVEQIRDSRNKSQAEPIGAKTALDVSKAALNVSQIGT